MDYTPPQHPAQTLATLDRLCLHHDHLKALIQEYTLMRHEHTYARMADPSFATDPAALAQVDSRAWLRTSLIVDLTAPSTQPLLAVAATVYSTFAQLVHCYYPTCEVDTYVDSAHITVKTLMGDVAQDEAALCRYAALIRPLVQRWVATLGDETKLYAVGLFSSLSRERGLSLGLRFYPSLPLLQLMRGEIGVALYQEQPPLPLRPERAFHTTLIHSTGLRARLTDFPLSLDFINEFRQLLEEYDRRLFGTLCALKPTDFVIRHGYSDQLVPLVEVGCG